MTTTTTTTTNCVNGTLAVEPIVTSVEKEVRHGVALAKQKIALIATKVVFPDAKGDYLAGEVVYLRGDCIQLPWAREVFELDGKKFILVPINDVKLKTGALPLMAEVVKSYSKEQIDAKIEKIVNEYTPEQTTAAVARYANAHGKPNE